MAVVYTNAGQDHEVAVFVPSTRGAQVTTYYGAWGSGSTAPAVAQTALVTELPEARVAATTTKVTTVSTGDTWRNTWTVTATGNRTVQEFGVFTASSAGTMIIRGTLASATPIETGDQIAWTVDLMHQNGTVQGD
jgi:hypothetical protein